MRVVGDAEDREQHAADDDGIVGFVVADERGPGADDVRGAVRRRRGARAGGEVHDLHRVRGIRSRDQPLGLLRRGAEADYVAVGVGDLHDVAGVRQSGEGVEAVDVGGGRLEGGTATLVGDAGGRRSAVEDGEREVGVVGDAGDGVDRTPAMTMTLPGEYCVNVVPVPTTLLKPFVTESVPGPVVIGMMSSVTPERPVSALPMTPFLSASFQSLPVMERWLAAGTWNAKSRSRMLPPAVTVAPICAPGEMASVSGRP